METFIFAKMRRLFYSLLLVSIALSGSAQQFLETKSPLVVRPKTPLFVAPGFQLDALHKDPFTEAFDEGNSLLAEEEYSAALAISTWLKLI